MYLCVRLVQDRIRIKMGLHEAGIEATLHPRVLRSEDGAHIYTCLCLEGRPVFVSHHCLQRSASVFLNL